MKTYDELKSLQRAVACEVVGAKPEVLRELSETLSIDSYDMWEAVCTMANRIKPELRLDEFSEYISPDSTDVIEETYDATHLIDGWVVVFHHISERDEECPICWNMRTVEERKIMRECEFVESMNKQNYRKK